MVYTRKFEDYMSTQCMKYLVRTSQLAESQMTTNIFVYLVFNFTCPIHIKPMWKIFPWFSCACILL